jgi:hypothetical protein
MSPALITIDTTPERISGIAFGKWWSEARPRNICVRASHYRTGFAKMKGSIGTIWLQNFDNFTSSDVQSQKEL